MSKTTSNRSVKVDRLGDLTKRVQLLMFKDKCEDVFRNTIMNIN